MYSKNSHCRSINNMAALKPGFCSLVLITLWLGSASGNVFAGGVPERDKPQVGDSRHEKRLALNSAVPNISEEQATQAALKAVPGEVTHFGVETKKGKKVYVIEIIAKKDGKETDVFVDMETGKVLGTD